MSMGSKLSAVRLQNNLTQEQLSEKLGVSRQAVSRWESDAAYPETDKIIRMAELFGVSCDYLLRDGPEVSPAAQDTPAAVTRLLRQAAGKRLSLTFYEDASAVTCDWCVILEFDGGCANVEFVQAKKGARERRLIPLSSIRSITFLPEEEG